MSVRIPHVDDHVVLLESLPETALSRGQKGVVCSQWSNDHWTMYEVEFVSEDDRDVSRKICTLGQIAVDEADDTLH